MTSFLTNTPQSIQFLGDLSAPSPFNAGATGQRYAKQEYYVGYAEDEWKLRPNLTLNYGLRYEYYTPLREDRNLQVLFDITNGTLREFSVISGTNALNPFAEVDYKTSGGHDSYNALQMTLARRLTSGLTMNAQYTFSRSIGNTAGSSEARTAAVPDNFDADDGYNNFDVRHTFRAGAWCFRRPRPKRFAWPKLQPIRSGAQ